MAGTEISPPFGRVAQPESVTRRTGKPRGASVVVAALTVVAISVIVPGLTGRSRLGTPANATAPSTTAQPGEPTPDAPGAGITDAAPTTSYGAGDVPTTGPASTAPEPPGSPATTRPAAGHETTAEQPADVDETSGEGGLTPDPTAEGPVAGTLADTTK